MKLYYAPGACSLACRISLHEAGIDSDFERVDLRSKVTEHGYDYTAVNPKGSVPMLVLDEGEAVTEALAVLLLIADREPALEPGNPLGRIRQVEMLSFLSSEMHIAFKPYFHNAGELEKAAPKRPSRDASIWSASISTSSICSVRGSRLPTPISGSCCAGPAPSNSDGSRDARLFRARRRALRGAPGFGGRRPRPTPNPREDRGMSVIAKQQFAGIVVPDTPLVESAIRYARQECEPYMFNHVMRSWLFAARLGQIKGLPFDEESAQYSTTSRSTSTSPVPAASKWKRRT